MLGIALVFDPLALAEPPKKPLRLSAEQKLYGPLQVTTAVRMWARPLSGKSISAGFKLNW